MKTQNIADGAIILFHHKTKQSCFDILKKQLCWIWYQPKYFSLDWATWIEKRLFVMSWVVIYILHIMGKLNQNHRHSSDRFLGTQPLGMHNKQCGEKNEFIKCNLLTHRARKTMCVLMFMSEREIFFLFYLAHVAYTVLKPEIILLK